MLIRRHRVRIEIEQQTVRVEQTVTPAADCPRPPPSTPVKTPCTTTTDTGDEAIPDGLLPPHVG